MAETRLGFFYAKYLKAQALTDKELDEFYTSLQKLCKLLFDMGADLTDPLFAKYNQALKDAYHMKASRKQKS